MNQENTDFVVAKNHLVDTDNNKEVKDDVLKESQLKFCSSLLAKIKKNPNASPFLKPVDPIALGVPDYLEKIKTPMDMSTIKSRLDSKYYSEPEEYRSDILLMFNNCYAYNHKDSIVFKMGEELQKAFESGYLDMPSEVKKRKLESVTTTIKPRRASKSPDVMNPDDYAKCVEVLLELEKQKHRKFSWPFLYPVTETDAPGYFSIISTPMDLSTVRTKLDTRKYTGFQEFISDLNLMIENCFKFNSSESEVAKCGEEFNRLLQTLLHKDKTPDGKIIEIKKKIHMLSQELKVLEQSSTKNLFTLDERERIGKTIIQMTKVQTEKVAEIVHRHCAYEYVDNDEIEINLQTMPDEVVAELDDYIQRIKNGDGGDVSSTSDD